MGLLATVIDENLVRVGDKHGKPPAEHWAFDALIFVFRLEPIITKSSNTFFRFPPLKLYYN